jgi:hypothetical protein
MIEAAPARCREKIAQSTHPLLCPRLDKGGYTVQPHPAPPPIYIEKRIIMSEGAINQ